MPETASFGYWVRRQRMALDLTQEVLASRVGCALVTIRKIEHDLRRPSRRMAECLVDQLAIPPGERAQFLQCAAGERSPVRLTLPQWPAFGHDGATTRLHSNLPAQVTSLVGRAQAVADVCALLRQTRVRLVTLTGAGGIGKTRLALQIAADLLDDFAEGCYFVPLASLHEPALVPSAIARTLGVHERDGQAVLESLKFALHARQLLLVVDNFEHLISAGPLMTELLGACAQMKILVTSREILHLYGEHEFAVPVLATPSSKQPPPLAALAQYAAVQLFIQRAQAVKPDFVLDHANAPAVAEICVRLDGLPLAIELAAARIKFFAPQALLQHLVLSMLAVLGGGARDLADRHKTLRQTIAWSYDLLSAQEQTLFRRLSVFVGTFSLEAAEAVCCLDSAVDSDVFTGMVSLVDKSLVRQVSGAEGEVRFVLLEIIREFGMEQLRADHEAERLKLRHAEYFLAFLEALEPAMHSSASLATLDRLEREHDNVRALSHWALQQRNVEASLRSAWTMHWFWYNRGYYSEAHERFAEMLALATGAPPSVVYAKALFAAGFIELALGNYRLAKSYFELSLAMSHQLGDLARVSYATALLANVLFDLGEFEAARMHLEEGLRIGREAGDDWHCAIMMTNMANQTALLGNFADARLLFEQTLAMLQPIKEMWGIGLTLYHFGKMLYYQGDHEHARESMLASKAAEEAVGMRNTFCASACHMLGLLDCERGDLVSAQGYLVEALKLRNDLENKRDLAYSFVAFAQLALAQGEPTDALRLAAAASALRTIMGFVLPPVERSRFDQLCATIRQALSAEAAAAAWAAGEMMTLDEAVAYALEHG